MKFLNNPLSTALYCVAFFFVLWLSLSGEISWHFILLGLFSALFTTILKFRFAFFLCSLELTSIIKYFLWLFWQIILSSLDVTKKIINISKKLEPKIITIENNLNNALLTTIFANSVTLTPGTATIYIKDKTVLIHVLDETLSSGINDIYFKIKNTFEKT